MPRCRALTRPQTGRGRRRQAGRTSGNLVNGWIEELPETDRADIVSRMLDKVVLPAGWRIGLDILKQGQKPASLNRICKAVEAWAVETAGDDAFAIPTKTFDADDWSIEIMLHGGFRKDVPPARMIATAMGDVRLIKPHEEIRDAVQFKGSRYGAMSLPYLIAALIAKMNCRAAASAMPRFRRCSVPLLPIFRRTRTVFS
jgi:hypothetical protein